MGNKGYIGDPLVDENGMNFGQPRKVDPKLRENLGIFEKEESVRSPAVLSMDNKNSYANFDLVVTAFEDLSREKNYASLPVNVLHNVFLFLEPGDLVHLFSTCRYFYRAGLNNLFWRKYYTHFFGMDEGEFENMVDLNYKKQFFKHFSDSRCANLYYLNNHKPIFSSEEEITFQQLKNKGDNVKNEVDNEYHDEYHDLYPPNNMGGGVVLHGYDYTICGPPNIGKRSLVLRLWKDQFDGDENNGYPQNELAGRSVISFKVVRRDYRHRKLKVMDHMYDSFSRLRILSSLNDSNIPDYKISTGSWVFCFIAGERKSFEEAKKYVKCFSKKMKNDVPKKQRRRGILVGLKSDLLGKGNSEKGVKAKEIKKFLNKYLLKGYVECSSKENTSCYLPIGLLVEKISWGDMVFHITGG